MTLNYGDYGIFLLLCTAGFISSTVVRKAPEAYPKGPST